MLGFDYGQFAAVYRRFESGATGLPRRSSGRPARHVMPDTGEIANFPGVSADYEEPPQPDLVLGTHELDVDQCLERIMAILAERGVCG